MKVKEEEWLLLQHMKIALLLGMVYYKPSTLETEVGSFIIVKTNTQTNKQKMQHNRN